jgi:hypothetical protein
MNEEKLEFQKFVWEYIGNFVKDIKSLKLMNPINKQFQEIHWPFKDLVVYRKMVIDNKTNYVLYYILYLFESFSTTIRW